MFLRLLIVLFAIFYSSLLHAQVKSYKSWHVTNTGGKCIIMSYPKINKENPNRRTYFISIYPSEYNQKQLIMQIKPGVSVYSGYKLSLRLNTRVYELKNYQDSAWSPSAEKGKEIIINMLKANDMTFRVRNAEGKLILVDRYDLEGFRTALDFLINCNKDVALS